MILGNKDRQPIGELKDPLPVEPFCILNVNFENLNLTDEDLAILAGCGAIEVLQLSGNRQVTAAGLKKLGRQPFLKELWITASDAVEWFADLPSLKILIAPGPQITAAGWEALPACPQLRKLVTSSQVGDAGLRRIVEQCPELEDLSLNDASISDLTPLEKLHKLRSLVSSRHALSDAGIDTLLKLPDLYEFHVDSPDAAGLQRLSRLETRLTRFGIRNQDGDDAFANSEVANREIWTPIIQLKALPELHIASNIGVDGNALQRVAAMANLRRFVVHDDSRDKAKFRTFTADDVAEFRKTRPDVELRISGQIYPALTDWPGKFEGSTRIAEWTEFPPGAPAPGGGTFSAEVAGQRQAEWAKHLERPIEFTNSVGMKFRLVPPGEAVVNSGTPEQPRLALQRVTAPYYLGATEVTVGQFTAFVEATGYVTDAERLKNAYDKQLHPAPNMNWKAPDYPISAELPVNVISPSDAQAFCDWLNLKSEISPGELEYRLPTEMEWEYACRAGAAGDYVFGGTANGVLD